MGGFIQYRSTCRKCAGSGRIPAQACKVHDQDTSPLLPP